MTRTTKSLRALTAAFCLVFVAGGMLAACSEDGPAENSGEKVDEIMNDAGEVMNEALDDTRAAVDEAADETAEAFEDATN